MGLTKLVGGLIIVLKLLLIVVSLQSWCLSKSALNSNESPTNTVEPSPNSIKSVLLSMVHNGD